MKKSIVSFMLVLLLCMVFVPAEARAEQDYINSNLGAVEAGYPFSCTLCDTVFPADSLVSFKEGIVPDGCSWYMSPAGEGGQIFLQGTPRTAGNFSFALTVSCAEPFVDALVQCAISVNPSQPVVQTGSGLSCKAGDSVSISVFASKNPDDGGTLSYQWYSSPSASNNGGTLIPGANASSYSPNTANSGYYYCVVTNNNGSMSASAVSSPIYVQVSQPKVNAISVAAMPTKLDYVQGDSIDTTGLEINAYYDNGSQAVVSAGFTVSPEKLEQEGNQTLIIDYMGATCSFSVNVEKGEPVIESISIMNMPSKTVYTVGESVDSRGMTLRVFTDQGYEDISSGFSCIPNSFMAAGQQTVTVQYEGKSCSFTVEVKEVKEELQSISVNTKPSKLSYVKGEQLDTTGLTLIISTNKGNMMLTEGFVCSPTVLNEAGEQTITVQYEGKSCSFTVDVSERGASHSPAVTVNPSGGNAASDAVRQDRDRGGSAVTVIIVSCVMAVIAVAAYLIIAYKKSKGARR